MSFDFKSIFDFTKVPTKFFAIFAISSGIILFTNQNLLKTVRLEKFVSEHGQYVGLVFIVSTCVLIINFSIYVYDKIILSKESIKNQQRIIEKLKNLDRYEVLIIRLFTLTNTNSISLNIDNPIVSSLLDKQIIKINNQFGSSFVMEMTTFTTNISLTEEAYKNLYCIKEKLEKPPTEEEDKILNHIGFTKTYH